MFFFFSSRRRHTRLQGDWSSDVCSSDLAEAGFGGNLNAFELMKAMIEAGAACVHFENQLSSAKKWGHLSGKVLVPTLEAIQKIVAILKSAVGLDLPTLLIDRPHAV